VPPYQFSAEVLAEWERTVAALQAMGIASSADANQIACYAEAAALHARASRELANQSLTVDGSRPRSVVINKLVQVQQQSAVMMLRFAQEFGLSPVARRRVDVEKPAGSDGFFG
jgi:P27 family predicted phage terminase small subunit